MIYEVVKRLEEDYTTVKRDLGYLLSTLTLERNRESLQKGEGLEELFDLIDRMNKKYRPDDSKTL